MTNGVDVNRNRGQILWNALRERDLELARMLVAEGAAVDLRFAAGVNRVDLMAEFFDAEGQLKERNRPSVPSRPGHRAHGRADYGGSTQFCGL